MEYEIIFQVVVYVLLFFAVVYSALKVYGLFNETKRKGIMAKIIDMIGKDCENNAILDALLSQGYTRFDIKESLKRIQRVLVSQRRKHKREASQPSRSQQAAS